MNYILWFLKLRFLILKNILWKDTKAIIRTLSIAAVIIIFQIFLTNLLYKNIFSDIMLSDEEGKVILILFFFGAVIWIYLISFVQSIVGFIRNFFKSPDMNYLISIPVPSNYVFLFKFFEHIINSIKAILFIVFPFLAAIGMSVNAPWIYFVTIIPFYIILSIIPCSIGIVIAMVGVRIVSSKMFSIITSILSFTINIIFAVLFSRVREIPSDYFVSFIEFLQKPLLSDVIPVTAGIRLFYATALGERVIYALLFLLIITVLFIAATFIISKKLFFEGWVKSQSIDTKVNKTITAVTKNSKKSNSKNSKKSNRNEIFEWIKTEWKMAIRNKEQFIACASMLLFFLAAAFMFIYSGYFSNEPLLGVFILITVASIFNIFAVSISFIPIDIATDKNLWKNRYWILKIMPLEGKKVFEIQCIMHLVPAYIISLTGILSYSIINGLSFPMILLSALSLLAILYGSSAVYTFTVLLSLTDFFEQNAFIGNLMSLILPVFYGVLSAGTITLFLAEDFVNEIMILSHISRFLNLPIVVIISVITLSVAYFVARISYIKIWEQLEI